MPRSGTASGGGFSTGGSDFRSNPFGDSGGSVESPGGGGPSGGTSGATPGTFSLDVTSPMGLAGSINQDAKEGNDFIAGLGSALFGKDNGSIFGGVPGVGDLGRFVGGNPISQAAYSIPGHAADLIGGAAEHVSLGNEDLSGQYAKLPDDIRAEYDKKIADMPDIANHLRFEALQAKAQQDQLANPKLNPGIDVPTGSLADSFGRVLGVFGMGQRLVERGLAGAERGGADRLQEIENAASAGGEVDPVEQIALTKWQSGEWSHSQALDFLTASHSGIAHNKLVELAGTFATDPLVAGSFGAAGLAKLGKLGVDLRAAEDAAGGAKLLAGTGKVTGTRAGTEMIRLLSTPYSAIEGTAIGKAAEITRNIIDPLHGIGQRRTAQESVVDIASEATPRAVASAYGEANHLNVLRYARSTGPNGEMYDMLTNDLAVYGSNAARRMLATWHQGAMLSAGLGHKLLQTVPGDILDDLAKNAPRGFADYLKDEVGKFRITNWDEEAKANLATRMEAMYPLKTRDEYLADIGKMNPDELGLIHAATYGGATRRLLTAMGKAISVYTGKLPLNRVVLLNRDTLTTIGAKGMLEHIDEAGGLDLATLAVGGFKTGTEAQVAIIKDFQAQYPELRYVTIDASNPSRSIARFQAFLKSKVDRGVLPAQITADELKGLPDEVQQLAEDIHGAWDLGFRPTDDLLWGLEYDTDGTYRAATVPWVDHVADSTPAFRAGAALPLNVAGQPIVGGVLRVATKPIDYIEAGARTMRSKVSSAAITEQARARFLGRVVGGAAGKGGMTEQEARDVFQAVLDAAQVNRVTTRGMTETNMWKLAGHAVPFRLRAHGYQGRELMSDVLHAYEGDLRFVGLTQKMTGRAKVLLQPFGGNVAGYIAEGLYPTVKYRLNAIFQTQERIEPLVLNSQRGIMPAFGNKLNAADRLTDGINQRLVDTSLVRAGDIDQAEFSAIAQIGDETKRVLTGHVPRDTWNALTDVQGVKRLNMLRTFQHGLGGKLREAWDQVTPGLWDDVKQQMSAQAGHVVGDDEVAVRYLSEQMLANDVHVNRLIEPGAPVGDFTAAIDTAHWSLPTNLGELRPINLDFLARAMHYQVEGGKVLANSGDLRAALAGKQLDLNIIEDFLNWHGAHADYISRVRNALEFSWDGFWNVARDRFNLSTSELDRVQQMMARSAEMRGMTPVEFVSQVFSPYIESGAQATINELGKAVSILRAPVSKGQALGTPEMLMNQLADVFFAHLDPSGQRALLQAFGKELPGDIAAAKAAGEVKRASTLDAVRANLGNEEFARRVTAYLDGTPPSGAFEDITDAAKGVSEVRDVAAGYMQKVGLTVPARRYVQIDEAFGKQTAKAYEALPPAPTVAVRKTPVTQKSLNEAGTALKNIKVDPEVRAAYQAFVKETKAQYDFIRSKGVKIVPVKDDPYANSAEMMADVRDNKTLKVFAGSAEHPLLTNEQNVMFRGVHDYFAHAAEGFQFGPRGELNAAVKHSQMYTPEARKAMLTETHGQNSVVNFSDRTVETPVSLGVGGAEVSPFDARAQIEGSTEEHGGLGSWWGDQKTADVYKGGEGTMRVAARFRPDDYARFIDSPSASGLHAPSDAVAHVTGLQVNVGGVWHDLEVPADLFAPIGDHNPIAGVNAADFTGPEVYRAVESGAIPFGTKTQTIAEVNKAKPGSIYAEQKAGLLPQDILDSFQDRYIGTGPGLEGNPDVLRAIQQFGKWSKSAMADGLLSAGRANPYSELVSRVAGVETNLAHPFNYTEQMLVNRATQVMRAKEQDAYRLQYFARNRSWFERSINHPFFGIYPASYMWGKIAPELIRFIAKEPFGIKTGGLAYGTNDVAVALAAQREFDPEFDKQMEKLGNSQAVWFAGYLLPAVPWDIGSAMPAWLRDISQQGLDNQARVDKGQKPKAINLTSPLQKVSDYISPFRSVFQADRVLNEVMAPPKTATVDHQPAANPSTGPVAAANLGPTLEEEMQALTGVLSR